MLKPSNATADKLEPVTNWIFEYNSIVDSYHKETDRAAAILAGSLLDEMLAHLLELYFVENKALQKDLLRGTGPLATFAARIKIAYMLGFMPESVFHDFERIRKIRNHFAHHPKATSFDESPAKDHCSQFAFVAWPGLNPADSIKGFPPRKQFLHAVASLAVFGQVTLELIGFPERPRCTVPPDGPRFSYE